MGVTIGIAWITAAILTLIFADWKKISPGKCIACFILTGFTIWGSLWIAVILILSTDYYGTARAAIILIISILVSVWGINLIWGRKGRLLRYLLCTGIALCVFANGIVCILGSQSFIEREIKAYIQENYLQLEQVNDILNEKRLMMVEEENDPNACCIVRKETSDSVDAAQIFRKRTILWGNTQKSEPVEQPVLLSLMEQGHIIQVIARPQVIEYLCKWGSRNLYYGFYYSFDDSPKSLDTGSIEAYEQKNNTWTLKKEGNSFYMEKVVPGWYYYVFKY